MGRLSFRKMGLPVFSQVRFNVAVFVDEMALQVSVRHVSLTYYPTVASCSGKDRPHGIVRHDRRKDHVRVVFYPFPGHKASCYEAALVLREYPVTIRFDAIYEFATHGSNAVALRVQLG